MTDLTTLKYGDEVIVTDDLGTFKAYVISYKRSSGFMDAVLCAVDFEEDGDQFIDSQEQDLNDLLAGDDKDDGYLFDPEQVVEDFGGLGIRGYYEHEVTLVVELSKRDLIKQLEKEVE